MIPKIVRKPIEVNDDIFEKLSKKEEPEDEEPDPLEQYRIPDDPKDWDIPF